MQLGSGAPKLLGRASPLCIEKSLLFTPQKVLSVLAIWHWGVMQCLIYLSFGTEELNCNRNPSLKLVGKIRKSLTFLYLSWSFMYMSRSPQALCALCA